MLEDLTFSLNIDGLEAFTLMPMVLINVAFCADTTAAWHTIVEMVEFVMGAPADHAPLLLALLYLLQKSVPDVLILANILLADGAAISRQAAFTSFAHIRLATFWTHQDYTLDFAQADAALGPGRLDPFLLLLRRLLVRSTFDIFDHQ